MKHAEVLILTFPYLIGGQSVNYAYYEAVDIWFYLHNFIHLTIFFLALLLFIFLFANQ